MWTIRGEIVIHSLQNFRIPDSLSHLHSNHSAHSQH
ncbi:Transposon TX1 uncharacterized protein, partial [Fusarium oxysporum f. sp. albedinis]